MGTNEGSLASHNFSVKLLLLPDFSISQYDSEHTWRRLQIKGSSQTRTQPPKGNLNLTSTGVSRSKGAALNKTQTLNSKGHKAAPCELPYAPAFGTRLAPGSRTVFILQAQRPALGTLKWVNHHKPEGVETKVSPATERQGSTLGIPPWRHYQKQGSKMTTVFEKGQNVERETCWEGLGW